MSTPDTTPPELTSLTIPSRIDVTSGPATLNVTASATDDLAGVGEMVIWLDDEIAYSFSPSSTNYDLRSLLGLFDGTDWSDGNATEDWSLAPTNASGTVNVTRVTIEDMQGNSREYQAAELASMGVNTQIEIVGAGGPAPRASLVASQDHRDFELALVADAPLDTPTLDVDITFASSGASFGDVVLYGSGALNSSLSTVNGTSTVSFTASLAGSFDADDPLVGLDFDVETEGSVSVASISVRIDGQNYVVDPADFDVVEPPNAPPDGAVTIEGVAEQGAALSADTSGLSDDDGLGTFSFQWLRDGAAIEGATGESYTLTQEDVGAEIAVQVSYIDGRGTGETVTSQPTAVDAMISGTVGGPAGRLLPDTEVRFLVEGEVMDAAQTDAQGDFALRIPAGSAGQLAFDRPVSAEDMALIGVSDALDALRLAVGLDPSRGPADGADFIAADFDGDGTVGVSDALDILRQAVGLGTGDSQPRWVFGDTQDADADNVPRLDNHIDIAAFTTDSGTQVQGILVGNMEDQA